MSITLQNLANPTLNLPAKNQNTKSIFEMREQPFTDCPPVAYAIALLRHYNFELRGYSTEELANIWLKKYPATWVRLGVIEALYLGRYKAVSVEQILAVWARRGQPIYRFTHEFERLISRKLPQSLTAPLNVPPIELNEEYNLPPQTYSTPEISKEAAIYEEIQEEKAAIIEEGIPVTVTNTDIELIKEVVEEVEQEVTEPLVSSAVSSNYEADWSRCEISKQPIEQFTPPPDVSGFYLKLKAVADKQDESVTQNNEKDNS
jgi:hypothetical protein